MSDSAHIHLLLGTDEFGIRQHAARLGKIFSDPTSASMNTSLLDGRTVSENEIGNATGAMPFLASQRLVVLENLPKRYQGAEGHKKFISLLETIPPSAVFILIEPEELKEKDLPNHWLVKWAGKNPQRAKAQGFFLPKMREMPAWVAAEAKRQGGKIDPNAAARLAEMTGENTRQAAQEITKLLTYVNYAHPVGLEDVEAVSIVSASADIFDLVDALGQREGKKAQRILRRLLQDKDAFELFGMVVRQFRLLLLAREVMDEGGTLQEAASALGVHPFVAEKAWAQARKFPAESLAGIHHRLLGMDEAAKTGGMSLDVSLEIFLVELTR